MEQAITIGLAEAIGIVVGIVGGTITMTFALLVYFDRKNERRIDEVKSDLAEHRLEFKSDLAEHRQEFKSDLTEHRQEFKAGLQGVKADLAEHRQEFKAGLQGVKADLAEHRQEFKTALTEHRQEFKADLQEVKADLQEVQRDQRALTSKVDRIQGTLDVLVFGERVPEPVARERAETTGD